jgi:hypothetical protein
VLVLEADLGAALASRRGGIRSRVWQSTMVAVVSKGGRRRGRRRCGGDHAQEEKGKMMTSSRSPGNESVSGLTRAA